MMLHLMVSPKGLVFLSRTWLLVWFATPWEIPIRQEATDADKPEGNRSVLYMRQATAQDHRLEHFHMQHSKGCSGEACFTCLTHPARLGRCAPARRLAGRRCLRRTCCGVCCCCQTPSPDTCWLQISSCSQQFPRSVCSIPKRAHPVLKLL